MYNFKYHTYCLILIHAQASPINNIPKKIKKYGFADFNVEI